MNTSVLLQRVGQVDPTRLEDYVAHGGFDALRRALLRRPEKVVEEVKASGLVGRGGAAFPTGVKWEAVARESRTPKYVVCNADESEPGTFKDRVLMEGDPFAVLEGMAIAAYATGASEGYIYVRGEYARAYTLLRSAVDQATQAGFLGDAILGSDFSFHVHIYRGAGAYVCGEETALFESIEGKRGQPRQKPPFPTTHGLFGQPTVINNVETLANVPPLILNGAEWFRSLGPEEAPGPKLFSVSGAVNKPGVYEATMDVTLRELIEEYAGGVRDGGKVQAVLVGGAAGTFVGPKDLDVPMSFSGLRRVGASPGSGAVMVVDERVNMWDVLLRIARFFAHESCGKCYPCRLGTQRQLEIVTRMASGALRYKDFLRLQDLHATMRDASLCGLGQTAGNAIISGLKVMGMGMSDD
ncbi:MAG: NADH-quinone oxidoreductase subunit NuoF [Chloroflexi bacterium]|nr:NADH-quinone oxidoreductase subunit NuoF [Chloroflexota bacterium]